MPFFKLTFFFSRENFNVEGHQLDPWETSQHFNSNNVFPSVQDCIKSQRDFLNEFSKPEESFNGKDVSVWRFRSISTNSVNFFWKVKRRQRRNFSFFDFFLIYFLLRKHCWARIKMPDDKQTKKLVFLFWLLSQTQSGPPLCLI